MNDIQVYLTGVSTLKLVHRGQTDGELRHWIIITLSMSAEFKVLN